MNEPQFILGCPPPLSHGPPARQGGDMATYGGEGHCLRFDRMEAPGNNKKALMGRAVSILQAAAGQTGSSMDPLNTVPAHCLQKVCI